ncbi:MAG TPA: ABC transporter permease subunit, partial [Vicinamibacterales bacterium]|nr:ABC transporter permease subunit [Vicinamibacterales bacterium]
MNNSSLLRSAVRVFDISLGQMLWSRRSVLLGLLVGAPVILAAAVRLYAATSQLPVINTARLSGPTLFGIMIWWLFVRFIVPVLGVFYGTALIADEVDDKTITYLFTRPVRRASVLIGKYL